MRVVERPNNMGHGVVARLMAIAVAATLPCAAASGQVQISPAYVEVALEKNKTASGVFRVSNLGDEAVRYRVNAVFYKYSVEGALIQIPTGDRSMAGWIIFNPKELTLAPNTQQAVRFAIVPRVDLNPGEYWAAMELESLKKQEATTKDANGVAVSVQIVATIQVPIFGAVGQVTYQGTLPEVRLLAQEGSAYVVSLVENTGTGRLGARGKYHILDTSKKVVEEGDLPAAYVLPASRRRFIGKVKSELPEGRYIVKVSYQAAHLAKPLEREIEVDWKPPPKPATATRSATSSSGPASSSGPTTTSRPASRPGDLPPARPQPASRPSSRPGDLPAARPHPASRPAGIAAAEGDSSPRPRG
jgi:hypothetical protein